MKIDRTGWLLLAAGVTLLVIAAGWGLDSAHGDPGPQNATSHSSPDVPHPARVPFMKNPCQFDEFVSDCYWNAQAQGDGRGFSFYSSIRPLLNVHAKRVGRVACVWYVRRLHAHPDRKWGACHILPAHGG